MVDVAVVAEASGAGLFVRRGLAEGDVAGLPIFWNFAGVDLVGEVAVDDVVGPNGRGGGAHLRVDAADARDEEVSVCEVEARVEAEGHDRGSGARGADAGENSEDSGFGIEMEVVVARGKREDFL